MTEDQIAFLAVCGLTFAVGVAVFALGVVGGKLTERAGRNPDNWGLVIGLGFICMVLGPLMLIGFPA